VSVNGNEEPAGEICHQYSSVVTAVIPYLHTIKLQYTVLGDYWECVRPARLSVLTWVPSSVPPGTNIQDTFLIGPATDTTLRLAWPYEKEEAVWIRRRVFMLQHPVHVVAALFWSDKVINRTVPGEEGEGWQRWTASKLSYEKLCVVCFLIMFPEYILMSCIWAYTYLVRCVLVLRCGLVVVVWYLYAGWGTTDLFMWNVGVGF